MTEIAPGMMVECIKSEDGYWNGRKAFIDKVVVDDEVCEGCGKTCFGLILVGWPCGFDDPADSFSGCCFRPIGGDKEIERELFEINPPKNKKIKNLIELASRPLKIYHCE